MIFFCFFVKKYGKEKKMLDRDRAMVRLHAFNRIERWQESTRLENRLRFFFFLVTLNDSFKHQATSFSKESFNDVFSSW